MGLAVEILGLVIFLGAHVFVTRRGERAALIAKLGEWPYRGLFSLVAIVGIVLIAYGFAQYRAAGLIAGVEPAALDASHRDRADVAGEHPDRGRLHPGKHQKDASSIRCWWR